MMSKTSWKWIACTFAAVLLTSAWSAPAEAQPLDSLVARAIESHPSVEAARIAIRQADARARGAAAWEPPSVGIEFRELPPTEPNPFAKGETMLMVEQMIPLFGQNRAMAQAMAIGAEVGEASLDGVRRELRGRVERDYYALWLLDRRMELNAESRKIADALYKGAEARYIAGDARQTDLLRIRIEIERLEVERREIAEDRAAATARLNLLTLRPESTAINVTGPLRADSLPPFDTLAARVAGHPELRGMVAMAKMAEAEAEAELAMLDPMLMLRGGIEYMPEGHPVREGNVGEHGVTMEGEPMRFGITAGAMISIPIVGWSRSGPEGKAEALRLDAARQLQERDAMRQEMTLMLRSAYSEARRAALRRDYHRNTQLPLLEQSLESLRGEYMNGRTPLTAVIDAHNMLVMARMDAYMQEMEYAMALSMITEMTGW